MGDTDPLKENCVIMTEDYYYNTDWKCVEERDSGETFPRKQYAYGIRGRNDLVARDNYLYNSSSGSPSCSSAGKERHYALTDAMGSVTAVASTAGAVVERYSYTAFGQSQVMTTSFADRSMSLYDWQMRFHGESRDEETGYYNYGYRYYDPTTGRWPSRDPIGELGGLSLYGMAGNDLINRWDDLGLDSPGCDGIPDLTPCMLEVCAEHDKCYRDNKCTSRSWFRVGGACSRCNFKAVLGMIRCLVKLCYDDPEKPNYYDAVTNTFFNDPKDPRAWNTTDNVKPPKRKRCKCRKRRIKYPTRR
jgi:RHS repeat-associated protein